MDNFRTKKNLKNGPTKWVHFSTPATPYQRLMQSEHLTDAKKQELTSIYNQLNPFELKKAIQKKLNKIFSHIHLDIDEKMIYK